MDGNTITILGYSILCAVLSGKWALELGVSQFRQILFMIGGLFLGAFMLLVLYIYLIRQYQSVGKPGAKYFKSELPVNE